MYQSGLDDLHYINCGTEKIIIDALSTKKYTNNYTEHMPDVENRLKFGDKLHHYIYPFTLKNKNDDKILEYIIKEVRGSKKFIPPYTAGCYIGLRGGNTRAVDYEDVFFRVIPAAIIPLLACPEAQQALRALLLASSIAMQWNITDIQLDVMERLVMIFLTKGTQQMYPILKRMRELHINENK